jgi:hypothetical protein
VLEPSVPVTHNTHAHSACYMNKCSKPLLAPSLRREYKLETRVSEVGNPNAVRCPAREV